MFGYVRPLRPELKCRDFDLYRATYCGLCRCMRRRYGLLAPMFLNYDFTFLTLLLWQPEAEFTPCQGRCHANPLRKKPMCPDAPALELAADESVILTWWKLRDSVRDDGPVKGMPARALSLLLRPAYRKAALRPEFDRAVRASLEELSILEKEQCPSIDRTADTFARLLQAAVPPEDSRNRVLSQFLYHLGRWIYLIDARDDREAAQKTGDYNPWALRYGPEGDDPALARTRRALLENSLYRGLPLVQRSVFDGSWAQVKNQKIWSNRQ